jgi:purine nucleosidase
LAKLIFAEAAKNLGETVKRIIIDCDPGIDDAQAIMMAYQHPNVIIEAITTVNGNVDVEKTTANALKILDVLDAVGVPVYPGAKMGLVEYGENASFFHGEDGLGDASIPVSMQKAEEELAALAMIRLAKTFPGELELIAIGPLTNLALALHLEPNLPSFFKQLVVMGGAYLAQGNTQNFPAEFNIFADPEAAKVVFDRWPEFTLVSWETTLDHGLPMDLFQGFLNHDNPRSAFLKQITKNMLAIASEKLKRTSVYAADPLAMAVLIEPEIVLDSFYKYVKVETHGSMSRGMTVVDWLGLSGGKPNVKIVKRVDSDRFIELYKLTFE